MHKHSALRFLVVFSLIITLLAGLFGIFQPLPAQASTGNINLIIDNRSSSALSLALKGPAQYYMTVAADAKKTFGVMRGTYSYEIKGCGRSAKGTFYLYQDSILINPVCGGNVHFIPKDNSKVNLGAILKVVPVTIVSDLTITTKVILTGTSTYVFILKPDQELDVTIGKGSYKVNYYACGILVTKEFQAAQGAVLTLSCP